MKSAVLGYYIKDVEEHTLKEISHFFEVCKELEKKKVEVIVWEGADKAKNIVQYAVESYRVEQKAKLTQAEYTR